MYEFREDPSTAKETVSELERDRSDEDAFGA
jgi:hypothetical protein